MFKLRNPFKKPEAETEGYIPDPAYPGEYRDLVLFLNREQENMRVLLEGIEVAIYSNDIHQMRDIAQMVKTYQHLPAMPPDDEIPF